MPPSFVPRRLAIVPFSFLENYFMQTLDALDLGKPFVGAGDLQIVRTHEVVDALIDLSGELGRGLVRNDVDDVHDLVVDQRSIETPLNGRIHGNSVSLGLDLQFAAQFLFHPHLYGDDFCWLSGHHASPWSTTADPIPQNRRVTQQSPLGDTIDTQWPTPS